MEEVFKYFPDLAPSQRSRFGRMEELYGEWNGRINVVSRKDIGELGLRHVLHSLAIARVCRFAPGARVLDVGCGGGFPGIPLAVMFPETHFTLADSIGKKITVVREVAAALGLDNVTAVNARAESIGGKFDYVVSRAVTDMATFIPWVWNKIEAGRAGSLASGILYLKGGNLGEEMARTRRYYETFYISRFFDEPFFETKKVVYIPKK